MDDNALIKLLADTIDDGLARMGRAGIFCVQKNQPAQQGTASGPTVYLQKLFDSRYGWPVRKQVWNDQLGRFDIKYLQHYQTDFQISALVVQDPSDLSLPTASDLVNDVAMWLAIPEIIAGWKQQEVNVLRTTQVRNPYFTDDRDRREASPSFDITLTHWREVVIGVPPVLSFELKTYPV
ncbi:hypothetical protein [Burkholderia phage BCSR129]|nr:hypothetical protein [Burkholderia phage BCSR129]